MMLDPRIETEAADAGWAVIHMDDLSDLLERAHAGEEPDAILLEWYANVEHDYATNAGEELGWKHVRWWIANLFRKLLRRHT